MRILYVEDERELSSAVCAGLRKCSYASVSSEVGRGTRFTISQFQ